MQPIYELGDAVRVVRNVRDDGTYPGSARGDLLVRRGSVGHVVDIGSFLMDQVIYSVHFLANNRIVGCREEELIGADEAWAESKFETRERVCNLRPLALGGIIRVPAGSEGEVLKVLREQADDIAYHVHFDALPGHTLQVREAALEAAPRTTMERLHV
ncbi:nitrogen fixation protein NifZ [Niveibacterium sp. 24ML]|uniref:nitrogen fixation protein NifZ n=1 Tax=Niveibacterium sp. 24ML TaxID=2985512 RepID=UPI00226F547B|nr:nitrogen fixation protein NifZ [Niveibacterium sp. 24ML]MCX9154637.1 nitrogen fixation protein NifZ [Niveibacterium sp. 24ML]